MGIDGWVGEAGGLSVMVAVWCVSRRGVCVCFKVVTYYHYRMSFSFARLSAWLSPTVQRAVAAATTDEKTTWPTEERW